MTGKPRRNRNAGIGLAVLNLYSRGLNRHEIARNLNVYGYRVERVLQYLNTEARAALKSYIISQVPLEWASSIELQRLTS